MGRDLGLVLVTTQAFTITTRGQLWWRRWGPTHDILWLWTRIHGKFSDRVLPEDAADAELADYDQGRFRYYGEPLRVEWLRSEGSASERAREFDE